MKIFLSWSGPRSRSLAEALRDRIPQVIQAVEPWMSPDIEKGRRWNSEISNQLEESRVGIICLTKENLESPWLCFEAGALSKTNDANTCTLLLDIRPADVDPPLGTFQHTLAEKEDVRKLMHTINTAMGKEEKPLTVELLNKVFDRLWPDLEAELETIAKASAPTASAPPRSDSEILAEILDIVRSQQRTEERPKIRGVIEIPKRVRELQGMYADIKELQEMYIDIRELQDILATSTEPEVRAEAEKKLEAASNYTAALEARINGESGYSITGPRLKSSGYITVPLANHENFLTPIEPMSRAG
jgi:hypothetical protein